MEVIKNYKFKEFVSLKDYDLIELYLPILEALQPPNYIYNSKYRWWKKEPRKLQIKSVREFSFGDVTNIRTAFSDGQIESVLECLSIVTGLSISEVQEMRIIDFYGLLAKIRIELEQISMMEINELSNDDFDIFLESVNANERMGRFGVLNAINSLANDDLTKWKEIQDLPYMTVFTKLKMDNEKLNIQKEVAELQKKKNK